MPIPTKRVQCSAPKLRASVRSLHSLSGRKGRSLQQTRARADIDIVSVGADPVDVVPNPAQDNAEGIPNVQDAAGPVAETFVDEITQIGLTNSADQVPTVQLESLVVTVSEDAAESAPASTALLMDLTQLFESRKKPAERPFLPALDGFLDSVLGSAPRDYTSKCIKEFVGPHDGFIRLIKPIIPRAPGSADPSTLPLLFYLPGIDGTGLAAYRQFPTLADAFDLRCFVYPPGDRTPFEELVEVVGAMVRREVQAVGGDRPVYLLGESFGGLLCLGIAASDDGRAVVDRVVLVNPATSFARSPWPMLGPALTAMPQELYSALPFVLSPILTSPFSIAMHSVDSKDPIPTQFSDFAYGLVGLTPELGNLRQVLPAATLAWRLQLLQQGCLYMDKKYTQVAQRVLVLCGERDMLIPSETEGPALCKKIPRARHMVLEGRSHALLQEAGVNLVDILQELGFYVPKRIVSNEPPTTTGSSASEGASRRARSRAVSTSATTGSGAAFGKPYPLQLPTDKELDAAVEAGGLRTLRRLVSPVFYSTEASGKVVQGLGALPEGRPLLFVGNHQLFAPDMPLMIEEFLLEQRTLLRGMAHPFVLAGNGIEGQSGSSGSPTDGRGFGEFLKTFGAVPVNGRNMFTLLNNGEAVLLYPGGVREAMKNKGEKYQLIWPKRAEFVRMAAKFGATIIPFAAIGAEDGVNLLLDQNEIKQLPVVGEWVQRNQSAVPQARTGVSASETNVDSFVMPLISINPPERFYYVFQKPITTSPDMANDKETMDALYTQVKGEVEGGVDYLLRKREEDPYRDLLPRLFYEATWGGKQAPSFTP